MQLSVAPSPATLARPRSFSSRLVPIVFGCLDACSPLAYILDVRIGLWYVFVLAVKIIIVILNYPSVIASRPATIFACMLVAICGLSNAVNGLAIDDYFVVFGFIAQLFTTLAIVRRENLDLYIRYCVYTIFMSTITYLILFYFGRINDVNGRYFYFSDNDPNLGSEIIGMAILLGSFVLPAGRMMIIYLPSMYAINLMQGRAAMIASIIVLICWVLRRYGVRPVVVVLLFGAPWLIFLVTTYWDPIMGQVGLIFQLDDPYRGVTSGFVGNATSFGQVPGNIFLEALL